MSINEDLVVSTSQNDDAPKSSDGNEQKHTTKLNPVTNLSAANSHDGLLALHGNSKKYVRIVLFKLSYQLSDTTLPLTKAKVKAFISTEPSDIIYFIQ